MSVVTHPLLIAQSPCMFLRTRRVISLQNFNYLPLAYPPELSMKVFDS